MTDSNCENARNTYNVRRWSDGYFDIDENGHVVAITDRGPSPTAIALTEVVAKAQQQGLSLPLLVRFTDILSDRVERLNKAFRHAIASEQLESSYHPVYPIKVNQQRRVITQMLKDNQVGLESGSKAELLAILSLVSKAPRLIICNGYKDKEYIRLALAGQMLGHQVVLIIEKKTELAHIIEEAQTLGIRPKLGLRIRLNTVGKSNWQNTGGPKSKFGVTTSQCLEICDKLKSLGLEDCLTVLHAHMGSQITQLSDVIAGTKEIARWYVALRHRDIPLSKVDVGGGLGVDYEGTSSRSFCSMNYNIGDYAGAIVSTFNAICSKAEVPVPDFITESGRAMTAHHAVLLTQAIDQESPATHTTQPTDATCQFGNWFEARSEALSEYNAVEIYHQALNTMREAQLGFVEGTLSVEAKAYVEHAFSSLLAKIKSCLNIQHQAHREVLDELNEKLATKYFCNVSIFQSLPDIWAIKQVFPILPIAKLDGKPTHRAVLKDMTCDSDGRVELYVDGMGVESTLPLPDLGKDPVFAVFLVGAYQEILGDLHNLFGDTDSVHVVAGTDGFELVEPTLGQTKQEVLDTVQFDTRVMIRNYKQQIEQASLSFQEKQMLLGILVNSLNASTYLNVSDNEQSL